MSLNDELDLESRVPRDDGARERLLFAGDAISPPRLRRASSSWPSTHTPTRGCSARAHDLRVRHADSRCRARAHCCRARCKARHWTERWSGTCGNYTFCFVQRVQKTEPPSPKAVLPLMKGGSASFKHVISERPSPKVHATCCEGISRSAAVRIRTAAVVSALRSPGAASVASLR